MNGGKPVRCVLALLIGWTVLREAEVGPLRALMHGPAFGKLAYSIMIVGASLLTLWRARSIRGREGLAWGLIGTGSRGACSNVYWTMVLAKRSHSRPVALRRRLPGLLPAPLRRPVPAPARARRRPPPHPVGRRAHRRASPRRAMSAAVVFGDAPARRRRPAGRRHDLAYPSATCCCSRSSSASSRSRGWRLDRRGPCSAGGIVALLGGGLALPGHRRQRDLRYRRLVRRRLDSRACAFGAAAWRPARRTPSRGGAIRLIAVPLGFAQLGLGLLVYAAFAPLNALAVGLAAASLLAVMARLVLTFRENLGMLRDSAATRR